MKDDKNIKFVAEHYRPGCFNPTKAWSRLGIGGGSRWKNLRVAATIAAVIAFSAVATIVYRQLTLSNETQPAVIIPEPSSPAYINKVIDFENTVLPTVIERIKEVYGVNVVDLPEEADQYKLSLHYEGNAIDLVETINNILDTNMKIEEL